VLAFLRGSRGRDSEKRLIRLRNAGGETVLRSAVPPARRRELDELPRGPILEPNHVPRMFEEEVPGRCGGAIGIRDCI